MSKAIAFLVEQILEHFDAVPNSKISWQEYRDWAAGFVFEGLRNLRYGQSFCQRFHIRDHVLYNISNVSDADAHIRKHYVERRS